MYGTAMIKTIVALPFYTVAVLAMGIAVAAGYVAYLIEGLG